MSRFAPEVVAAVLTHMNDDHTDDSLQIVQEFGAPAATAAVMTDLDTEAGEWTVTEPGLGGGSSERVVRVDWTIPVVDRVDLRRAVVMLHRVATRGQDPRHQQEAS